MKTIEELGTLISTDILIIGAGVSGLSAAIKAGEAGADVLIVDKATAGYTGMGAKAGHGYWVTAPGTDTDPMLEWHVRNEGCYLNDQELMESIAAQTYAAATKLSEWGMKFSKNEDGSIHVFALEGQPCTMTGINIDYTPLRNKAVSLGARILNKVQITDLIKKGSKVIGAVGYDLIEGTFYIIKARATILATAGCNFNVARMWNGTGEGVALAYRAGAQMRNPEFGNFYEVTQEGTNYPTNLCCELFIYNALGENLYQKYVTGPGFEIFPLKLFLGIEKEINEGRGPIREDVAQYNNDPIMATWMPKDGTVDGVSRYFPRRLELYRRLHDKEAKYSSPVLKNKSNVTLTLFGELGPVKIDHEGKTTVDGLWAAGHISYTGSAWSGAIPPRNIPGSSIANGSVMGIRAGASAAEYSLKNSQEDIDYEQIERLKEAAFAPMHRSEGPEAGEAILEVQNVICPIKYNLRRSGDRLEEAIGRIEGIKEQIAGLYAKDLHALCRCHEAAGIALCAEMIFRAALMRTESRGTHYREDYPERDDKNWLKWIIVEQKDGKMLLSTEPVPIERYKFKPTDERAQAPVM